MSGEKLRGGCLDNAVMFVSLGKLGVETEKIVHGVVDFREFVPLSEDTRETRAYRTGIATTGRVGTEIKPRIVRNYKTS